MNSSQRSGLTGKPYFLVTLAIGCVITLVAQIYYVGWLVHAGDRVISSLGMVLGVPVIYLPWLAVYWITYSGRAPGLLAAVSNVLVAGFGLFGYLQLLTPTVDHSLSAFAFAVVPGYQAIIMVFLYLWTLRKDKHQERDA